MHYNDIGDYLTRQDKLRIIKRTGSLEHLDLTPITPNAAGDWLDQRNDEFGSFIAIGEKDCARLTVFGAHSLGLASNRDAWVYNSSSRTLLGNMASTIDVYNGELARWLEHRSVHPKSFSDDRAVSNFVTQDAKQISWSSGLISELKRGRSTVIDHQAVAVSTYRPFFKQRLYFSQFWNNRTSQLPRMFPTSVHLNHGFYVVNPGAGKPFSSLMMDEIPDLAFWGSEGGQFFSRYTYEAVQDDGALFDAAEGEVIDGYRRIDNITDEALAWFHTAYGPGITKDDVFFYVYGLLHCPDYRNRFAADLKKMLPRIPLVANATPFIDAGRALSELHLGYESAKPYPLDGLPESDGGGRADASDAAYNRFRVEKMRFGKPTSEQKLAGLTKDVGTIVYNDHLTLHGMPEEAYCYMLGSRSVIEWIMERYQVKVDKDSQIRNDPNDWSREVGDPRYILDLLARIVTVSLETMTIVDTLPTLDVLPTQENR